MTRTGRLAAAGLVAATLTLAGGTMAQAATGSTSPDATSSSTASAKAGDNGSWTKGDEHGHGEWPKGAPHTGDGASMLTSGGNVATGATLAAAGLGVGAFALRRRRAAQSN
jgi:hypothetical protein